MGVVHGVLCVEGRLEVEHEMKEVLEGKKRGVGEGLVLRENEGNVRISCGKVVEKER